MRAPLSWIRDFTPVDAPVEQVVAALNQLGLEVEAVDELGRDVRGVVVAEVLGVSAHPNADTLTLVDVDHGDGRTRVVCGATNVVPGMRVPYAAAGAVLPAGRLERRTIRGETSDGMLCSAAELGFGDDHEGILALDGDATVGTDVRAHLGLDDVVFDLSITPNRPDAMCVVGVARELAAHFGLPLDVPEARPSRDRSVKAAVSITIEAPDRCPRYVGWVAGVTNGASPPWMRQRLVKAGMRPISSVVDVTNYVLLERNQPLHAFDLARLGGHGIIVRLAREQETIVTLDGVTRSLTPEDLLICDADSTPQAVAGIMGGAGSEVDEATTEILLEAAYFEPMGIARSSKRLKLRSESSARFERGIDADAVAANAARAMELLEDVAAARVAKKPVDRYPTALPRPRITLRTTKVNGVLGTSLTDTEVIAALEPLGVVVAGGNDDMVATPPSFRPDLEREIDLVEEVARRVGFGAIGRTIPKPRQQIGGLTRSQRERRVVSDALVGAGLAEVVTLPLLAPADLEQAGAPVDRLVRVANPLRAEESALRSGLLPGLLRVVARNQARGIGDVAIFETGRVFRAPGEGVLPEERIHVAAVLAGLVRRAPVEPDRVVDPYDAVDALRALLAALEATGDRLVARTRPGFRPGRCAAIEVDGDEVGIVGEVADNVSAPLGLTPPVVAFELDLDRLLAAPRRDRRYVPPSAYPAAAIDLAFVVADDVDAASIESTLRQSAFALVEDVGVFDEFRSDDLGPGRRSLAFRLRYRAPDHTLSVNEVSRLRADAIRAVSEAHGAELRG